MRPINPRGNSGDEAVFRESQIGNQIVKLKDEANLVAQKAQQVRVPVDFNAVDRDSPAVGHIEPAEQVQQRAFAAARRSAKSHGLARGDLEIHALENRDCPLVVALPHILRAQNNAPVSIAFKRESHSNRSASTARIRMA